jgi:hypothetical protein
MTQVNDVTHKPRDQGMAISHNAFKNVYFGGGWFIVNVFLFFRQLTNLDDLQTFCNLNLPV